MSAYILVLLAALVGLPFATSVDAVLFLVAGALAPDLADIPIWIGYRLSHWSSAAEVGTTYWGRAAHMYRVMEDTVWNIPAHIAQSHVTACVLWILAAVFQLFPLEFVVGYHTHIILDQFSHKRHWALYPFSKKNVAFSSTNWYDWKAYRDGLLFPTASALSLVAIVGLVAQCWPQ
jgi:hypothetical protein